MIKKLAWQTIEHGITAVGINHRFTIRAENNKHRLQCLNLITDKVIDIIDRDTQAEVIAEANLRNKYYARDFIEPSTDIFDEILQWHKDACPNPTYADELVARACIAEEDSEYYKSLTYFYEADVLRESAKNLYKAAEHARTNSSYEKGHWVNRKEHLDAIVDGIWVKIQDGYRSGYDVKGALLELIKSNNSKRLPDGTFPRNEAGKIIKTSPTFTDVDLTEFI